VSKKYFGYIRVSTTKQGEKGSSLHEQHDAIERYAQRNGLEIVQWFEEIETAAKRGRPVFRQLLQLLEQGKADGMVLHKIDRGARNLRDWADLADLNDHGIAVRFANENLDLNSRSGRLSADIQAVVAADYIRNLREEVRKGFYGRLKQGLYPLQAPIGYLDMGKGGKVKELDPEKAPLIRKIFELYASGQHSLISLADKVFRLGLRNRRGGKVNFKDLSRILNNPFYIGLIRIRKTGETFAGIHTPLISKTLFDHAQAVLRGKFTSRGHRHQFLFRKLFDCEQCGYSLIGEKQKGHVYYRCHTRSCSPTCIRENFIQAETDKWLQALQLDDQEWTYVSGRLKNLQDRWAQEKENRINALRSKLGQIKGRLNRITDAYVDAALDRDSYESRKAALLHEQKATEEEVSNLEQGSYSAPARLQQFLELARNAYITYTNFALPEEKQDFLRMATSNRTVQGKTVHFELNLHYQLMAERFLYPCGAQDRDTPRTWDRLFPKLVEYFSSNRSPDLN